MGDPGSIPGLGRSPGAGNSNLLQYSCLENLWIEELGRLYSPWGRKDLNMLSIYMCVRVHPHTHIHTELLLRVIVRLNKVKCRKCSE